MADPTNPAVIEAPARVQATLVPVSGVAVPVYRGEVLRITQNLGHQPVSFNCFDLHDYKQHLAVGHMRREGFRSREGRMLWSNPPRFKPMMKILSAPDSCRIDTLVVNCAPSMFEYEWQMRGYPSCHDMIGDAIGAYGLAPDDVHDSLNFWMSVELDHIGYRQVANGGAPYDSVDLLALMDVLAVPATCGAASLSRAAGFECSPVDVQVFASTPASRGVATAEWDANTKYVNQRGLEDFEVRKITPDRALHRDPTYRPNFRNFPIRTAAAVEVELSSADYRRFWHLRGVWGDTDEEVARAIFMRWYIENRKKPGIRWGAPTDRMAP